MKNKEMEFRVVCQNCGFEGEFTSKKSSKEAMAKHLVKKPKHELSLNVRIPNAGIWAVEGYYKA